MFNIKRPEKITLKVSVRIPGEREAHKFTGHFAYLDMRERKEFVDRLAYKDSSLDDMEVVKDLLIGWEDLKQANGDPLEFNEANVEKLMNIPYARAAVMKVVMSDILSGGFVVKN